MMKMKNALFGALLITLATGSAAAQVPASFQNVPGSYAAAHQDPQPVSAYQTQQPGVQVRQQQVAPATQPAYVDPATAARMQQQANGNYDAIARTVGVPFGTTQDAWENPFEHMAPGQVSPGVVKFHWTPELVMPVRVREFMVTMIILPDWEKVKDVYIGENFYFQAAVVRDNAIGLRTGQAGIDTSLTILGESGNLYTFYVRGEGFNTRQLTDLTVFVNAAPVDPGIWFTGQQSTDSAFQSADPSGRTQSSRANAPEQNHAPEPAVIEGSGLYLAASDLKFVHRMYEVKDGDRVIAPEYVATDGKWTYFNYGDRAGTVDRPVVYRIVEGVETIVNTRTIGEKGEVLVAEAVGEFVLRNGTRTICVKLDPSLQD